MWPTVDLFSDGWHMDDNSNDLETLGILDFIDELIQSEHKNEPDINAPINQEYIVDNVLSHQEEGNSQNAIIDFIRKRKSYVNYQNLEDLSPKRQQLSCSNFGFDDTPLPLYFSPPCISSNLLVDVERPTSDESTPCFAEEESLGAQWNEQYNELVKFQRENGHCNVPSKFTRNIRLAQWVKRQRYQYKTKMEGKLSPLSDERQAALNDLGFIWDAHSNTWDERFAELALYKRQLGHCNVPTTYPQNQGLAVWVKSQRRHYNLYWKKGEKFSHMTPERIEKLNCIGFVWNPRKLTRIAEQVETKTKA